MSPSKTLRLLLGLCRCLLIGTLPPSAPPPRSAGVGSVAAVSLLFAQTVPGFFTQLLPGLQVRELRENQCLGFGALQDGGPVAGLNPTRERPRGLHTHPWGPALGSCSWWASRVWPLPSASSAGLSDSMFQMFTPAFGLTLHLTPDPVAHSHGLLSL